MVHAHELPRFQAGVVSKITLGRQLFFNFVLLKKNRPENEAIELILIMQFSFPLLELYMIS